MDWKAIIILSAPGFMMGLLSVRGFTQKLEPFLWLLFAVATALVISRNISQQVFLHGFITGAAWGALNGLIQSLFFKSYLSNNPLLRPNFDKVTFMPPEYFVIVTGILAGIISGLVLGGLSLLLKKLW